MKEKETINCRTEKNLRENMTGQVHTDLQCLFENSAKSILFAGVGNVLKKDDGAGVFIAKRIKQSNGISSLVVEMGIENHIGKINSLAPDILVIIDAAGFGEKPGFVRLAMVSEMKDTTTNTHNISLTKISELFNMPVYILGIQPADISFGEGMCREVSEAAERIIQMINSKSKISKIPGELSRKEFVVK